MLGKEEGLGGWIGGRTLREGSREDKYQNCVSGGGSTGVIGRRWAAREDEALMIVLGERRSNERGGIDLVFDAREIGGRKMQTEEWSGFRDGLNGRQTDSDRLLWSVCLSCLCSPPRHLRGWVHLVVHPSV